MEPEFRVGDTVRGLGGDALVLEVGDGRYRLMWHERPVRFGTWHDFGTVWRPVPSGEMEVAA